VQSERRASPTDQLPPPERSRGGRSIGGSAPGLRSRWGRSMLATRLQYAQAEPRFRGSGVGPPAPPDVVVLLAAPPWSEEVELVLWRSGRSSILAGCASAHVSREGPRRPPPTQG
jgi:hypothetical protein